MDYFHASQYDSPYQINEKVDEKRKRYETWERQSRIWGMYSEQTGEPFYARAKLNTWVSRLTPTFRWKIIAPAGQYFKMVSRPRLTHVPGLMDVSITMNEVPGPNRMNTWRIYEDPIPNVAYIAPADAAEGSDNPDAAQDASACLIMRAPIPNDKHDNPVIAASIRSTLPPNPFARTVAPTLRHYNNALFAVERGIGKHNEAVGIELEDWPYWFMYTVTNDKTGKAKEQKGFHTKSASRDAIFELIRDWIDDYSEGQDPFLYDEPLLKELAAAVVGKATGGKIRCDHPSGGTLDTAICFGIGLWIFKYAADQIRCNLRTGSGKKSLARNRHGMIHSRHSVVPEALGYRQDMPEDWRRDRERARNRMLRKSKW